MVSDIKSRSDENDLNPQLPVIKSYIENEINRYEQLIKTMDDDRIADWETLNILFLEILEG